MEIVSNEENADVISWLPHGKGFAIYKKKKFASDILPKYFKQSKYTSFTRKLNRWGFTRVTRGPETGAYYHKYFQRGETRLCMQMGCPAKMQTMSTDGPFPPYGNGIFIPDQNTIRQQLAHLQMQQLHLQQLAAMQQRAQQHPQPIQSASLFRHVTTNKPGGEGKSNEKDATENPFLQSLQPAKLENPYLQSLQRPNPENPFFQSVQWAHSQQGLMPALHANAMAQSSASQNIAAATSAPAAAAEAEDTTKIYTI